MQQFYPKQLISGKEDASNNFPVVIIMVRKEDFSMAPHSNCVSLWADFRWFRVNLDPTVEIYKYGSDLIVTLQLMPSNIYLAFKYYIYFIFKKYYLMHVYEILHFLWNVVSLDRICTYGIEENALCYVQIINSFSFLILKKKYSIKS